MLHIQNNDYLIQCAIISCMKRKVIKQPESGYGFVAPVCSGFWCKKQDAADPVFWLFHGILPPEKKSLRSNVIVLLFTLTHTYVCTLAVKGHITIGNTTAYMKKIRQLKSLFIWLVTHCVTRESKDCGKRIEVGHRFCLEGKWWRAYSLGIVVGQYRLCTCFEASDCNLINAYINLT